MEILSLKEKLGIETLGKVFQVSGREIRPSDSGCIYLKPFAQS